MAKKPRGDTAPGVEKVIGKEKLQRVMAAKKAAENAMASERSAFGDVLTEAVEKHGLHKKAFGMVAALASMPPDKQARCYRNFLLYCDHLGIPAQTDIEDFTNAAPQEGEGEGDPAGAGDGEAVASGEEGPALDAGWDEPPAATSEAMTPAATDPVAVEEAAGAGLAANYKRSTQRALKAYAKATAEGEDLAALNRGYDRFATDYPEAAAEARLHLEARLKELGANKRRRRASNESAAVH